MLVYIYILHDRVRDRVFICVATIALVFIEIFTYIRFWDVRLNALFLNLTRLCLSVERTRSQKKKKNATHTTFIHMSESSHTFAMPFAYKIALHTIIDKL